MGKKAGAPPTRRSGRKNPSVSKEKPSSGKSTKAPFKSKSIVGSEDDSAADAPSGSTKGKGKQNAAARKSIYIDSEAAEGPDSSSHPDDSDDSDSSTSSDDSDDSVDSPEPEGKGKAQAKRSTTSAKVTTPSGNKLKATKVQPSGGSLDDQSDGTPKKRRKVVTGSPRPLTPTYAKYVDSHYHLYDHDKPQRIAPYTAAFVKFGDFDDYTLYINPSLTSVDHVPTAGVRLDDLTLSKVLMTTMKAKDLHKNWPADLDKNGMPRATRAPLGLAAKTLVSVGDVDVEGDVCGKKDEGYYYLWWRGLHPLCGAEGLSRYTIRPSFEQPICDGVGFKLSFKATIQAAEGEESDKRPVTKAKKVEKKRSKKSEHKSKVDNGEGAPDGATHEGSDNADGAPGAMVPGVGEGPSGHVGGDVGEGAPGDNPPEGGNVDEMVGVEQTGAAIEAEGKADQSGGGVGVVPPLEDTGTAAPASYPPPASDDAPR